MASTSGFHSHNPSAFLLISDIFLQKHRTPAKTSKKVFRPEIFYKKYPVYSDGHSAEKTADWVLKHMKIWNLYSIYRNGYLRKK